jgi:hypothetical protein
MRRKTTGNWNQNVTAPCLKCGGAGCAACGYTGSAKPMPPPNALCPGQNRCRKFGAACAICFRSSDKIDMFEPK